jgi:cell fate regulator YaaT (PSP1 superfamily)
VYFSRYLGRYFSSQVQKYSKKKNDWITKGAFTPSLVTAVIEKQKHFELICEKSLKKVIKQKTKQHYSTCTAKSSHKMKTRNILKNR